VERERIVHKTKGDDVLKIPNENPEKIPKPGLQPRAKSTLGKVTLLASDNIGVGSRNGKKQ
jgi:hypothetical protein